MASKLAISQLLGISPPTLNRYISIGLPVITTGGSGVEWDIDPDDAVKWFKRYEKNKQESKSTEVVSAENLRQVRARKLEIEIEQKQFDLDKERNLYVRIDKVAQIAERVFSTVRTQLLSIPSKVAPILAGINDPVEVNTILDDYIRECLDEMSQGESNVQSVTEVTGHIDI